MHTANQGFTMGKEEYLADRALMSHMRALALEAKPDGYARICMPAQARRSLHMLRAALSRTQEEDRCPALQRAAEAAPFFEAAAGSARRSGCRNLPAVQGEARVQRIAREILLRSDGQPSPQRFEDALRAFSQARALRMDELARIPDAVRAESLRLFAHAAMRAVRMQNERDAAQAWAEGKGPLRSGCIFLEHALLLCREGDDARAGSCAQNDSRAREGQPDSGASYADRSCAVPSARRMELERALEAEEGGAAGVIARAHEKQALLCMWLENLPGALRMPAAIDPEALLAISDAARILSDLPAYSLCDEESRAAIRARIGEIAHAAKVSEAAVVRIGIELSREGAKDIPSASQYGYPGRQGTGSAHYDRLFNDAESPAASLRAEPTYYWADDTGRRLLLGRLGRADVRMKKLTADPNGLGLILCVTALSVFFYILLHIAGLRAVFTGLIGCWTVAAQAIGCISARIFPPRTLLRLQFKNVPDEMRTLVVIPAILPSAERAQELAEQLETLAAGEKDPNIEFCLLGDFPDASAQSLSGDGAILQAARGAIEAANSRIGSRRLYFLHRERQWSAPSGRWMGRERKRGALHALGALLLRGENEFAADGADAHLLAGRFRYIITLDADTRPYPGALRKLIGAIAHPLNRLSGKNILQPRMAQSAHGDPAPFVRFMSGGAGVSGYGGGVSELYQDLCGQGGYAGKGIYDIAAFDSLAAQALPENAILSHDLIEGFLAGSAFVSDIVFLDHFPGSLVSYFKRLHRWTRGDWQLLPFLKGRTPLQKYRMLDNLRASLAPLSALMLILTGLAAKNAAACLLGVFMIAGGAVFSLGALRACLRALADLSLLPNDALCRTDAALRALWRTFVSHRGMLEWVSAADAERQGGKAPAWPRIAAAFLCAAASLAGGTAVFGFGFALLFLMGAPVLESMEHKEEKPCLSADSRAFVASLARDTWQFFANYTCESGFPPDNVQFDPPKGAADRTSPTNIGLYMVSCVSAESLGLIGRTEMISRIETTVRSIEQAEKWRGQMYNWYDPITCAPLQPRYVSSVDSGNLAASLLLCAEALRDADGPLSVRLERLARDMDLGALYDPVRRLFRIGYDAEKGAFSASFYDLIASEARILSYTAIMLGKVPPAHWQSLSRACVSLADGSAPLSWSGTMFEYLMPELFLPTPGHTLLAEAARICVLAQKKNAVGGFWGISESGYYAFDARRNFQYRAFGVREMMLRDERTGMVISPYSSALALETDPDGAAENLKNMRDAGFVTPCGLAEAIDFTPERLGNKGHALVCSAMAHHQGMILIACANALTGGGIRAFFARRSDARAYLPLLEEETVPRTLFSRRETAHQGEARRTVRTRGANPARAGKRGLLPPDGHLLCGGGSSLYISADGASCLHAEGLRVNRFLSDTFPGGGFYTHVQAGGDICSLQDGRARFSPGGAKFFQHMDDIDLQEDICLSPEDGALLRLLTLRSRADRPVRVEIRDIALLSLCRDAEADEHPAFHDLFLECSYPDAGSALPGKPQGRVLRILRRPRGENTGLTALDYSVSGLDGSDMLDLCADRIGMLPRGTDAAHARGVFSRNAASAELLTNAAGAGFAPTPEGAGISPIQGARVRLTVPARGERVIGFASLVSRSPDKAHLPEYDRYLQTGSILRAQRLAEAQSRALLRLLSVSGQADALFGRAASMCFYTMPVRREGGLRPDTGREKLWPLGISGEKPVLAAIVQDSLQPAAQILRLHAYLRAMGMQTDAVILYEEETGYSQPMRDDLAALIDEMRLQGEGAALFARTGISEETYHALIRLSALLLRGEETLESMLSGVEILAPNGAQSSLAQEKTALSDPRDGENYGFFSADGSVYNLALPSGVSTPHAWSNILAGQNMGALSTETGSGFLWRQNSRNARLTPFRNDPLAEGAAIRLQISDGSRTIVLMPRPAEIPAEVHVRQGESEYILHAPGICARIIRYTHPDLPVHAALIHLECTGEAKTVRLQAQCGWLMGVHPADARALQIETQGDIQFAAGALPFTACMRLAGAQPQSGALSLEISLAPEKEVCVPLVIAAADTADEAAQIARGYDTQAGLCAARAFWQDLLSRVRIETGDPVADAILSRWAPYQAIAARFLGRAGLYQSGGAYGFRDQMQDALCLSPIVPGWTRSHILLCAAHQFPEGDVQHWWHPPRTGVRTRISDDLLFLPYVTAKYVLETGDSAILDESVPYLSGDELPEDRHDLYYEAGTSSLCEPLREHCLRAVRRVFSMLGAHGLPLMGCGDWNDGMDRIGAKGRGESVWLAQFLSVTAREFAEICPEHEAELHKISQDMLSAIELHAWDGDRYIRAYRDDGSPLGSETTSGGCKIDALCQSWAVLAGCDPERTRIAMDTMWERLYDEKLRILRLLDPPFDGNTADTGYIAAYPPGIRENGGQYTHAACWALLAFGKSGDRTRAWTLLRALLPISHADTREKADRYRVEPYALAADIYACGAGYAGRGGWTWYTGAAGWLFRSFLLGVAGFERRGDRVRMCALLDEGMEEMRVVLRHGNSTYTLISARGGIDCDWAELIDDGMPHELRFGAR